MSIQSSDRTARWLLRWQCIVLTKWQVTSDKKILGQNRWHEQGIRAGWFDSQPVVIDFTSIDLTPDEYMWSNWNLIRTSEEMHRSDTCASVSVVYFHCKNLRSWIRFLDFRVKIFVTMEKLDSWSYEVVVCRVTSILILVIRTSSIDKSVIITVWSKAFINIRNNAIRSKRMFET